MRFMFIFLCIAGVAMQYEVGIVGTGKMGSAMALNLLGKGYKVHVYNRTKGKLEGLAKAGAIVHEEPASLASNVNVVITSVTDHVALSALLKGQRGLLSGLKNGRALIEMSTIGIAESSELAGLVTSTGATWLDSPVLGGPSLIKDGKAVLLVGGAYNDFKKFQSLLKEFGSPIYLGEAGSGHKIKLALNLYLALSTIALSEAMVLSVKMGFKPGVIIDILNASHLKSGLTEGKGRRMAQGEFSPTFTLAHMLKDLSYARGAAEKVGAVLPLTSLATELYRLASLKGFSELDYSAIALLLSEFSDARLKSEY
jgi:3-hydroxyisobutyrate dehydrogenase